VHCRYPKKIENNEFSKNIYDKEGYQLLKNTAIQKQIQSNSTKSNTNQEKKCKINPATPQAARGPRLEERHGYLWIFTLFP
jgi:hypothetical protein